MTTGTTGEHRAARAAIAGDNGTAPPAARCLEVHLLAHTHWDREWYRPAVQFRPRLVHLIDDLLDRSPAPQFLLDGQAVVVEDYLAVRPDRASELSARLREGTLEAGPWYVLADELLPGGEALVRNLLAGRRVLRALRATPPGVLYCPDSFGHPAALPAIAAGFGCGLIVLWRGYGGPRWPSGDTARWRAPDGSTVLLHHLPPDGYETGSHLPLDRAESVARWIMLRATLAPRASTDVVLLPSGADHHALPPRWQDAVAALSAALEGDRLVLSSLARFRAALEAQAAGRALPEVRGELRDSYGYAWTLQGTFGVRAALKRRNARVERLLVRDCEPWVAMASLRDGGSRRAALLETVWRTLLLCHPHDTLCGCSIDAVAEAMTARLSEAADGATVLRDEALDRLLGHDRAAIREHAAAWRPVVVVRNRAPRRRSGVAEVTADLVLGDVAVGPGSAGVTVTPGPARPMSLGRPPVAIQVLDQSFDLPREESPHHYPRTRLVDRRRLLAWVEVPAYGLRILPVEEARRRPAPPASPARAHGATIENGAMRVAVQGDALVLAAGDREIRDWLTLEAEGEQGDLYTHSPIPGTLALGRIRRSRVTARGPLRAELTVEWEVDVAERYVTSAAGEGSLVPAARLPVRTIVQLDAGAPFARVLVEGDQRTSDVRVRLVVRTDVRAPRVMADAAFGPVERRPLELAAEVQAMERPDPAAPLHRYVSCFDGTQGATVYGDGLTEYEAAADGTVAVTLTRSVGELSRGDLPERPGHAGYPVPTPVAQARGPFDAAVAFLLHGPRTPATIDSIEQAADDALLPLVGHPWRTAVKPPKSVAGAALEGPGLACSAVKESEDGHWVVLRCVNLLEIPAPGSWTLEGISEARLARLDETPLGALAVRGGAVRFEAPPRGIVTILVR